MIYYAVDGIRKETIPQLFLIKTICRIFHLNGGMRMRIGFIGAGIIFKDGIKHIHNLTTAVLVWVVAALGCLIALGLHIESLIMTIVIYTILRIYKKVFDHENR